MILINNLLRAVGTLAAAVTMVAAVGPGTALAQMPNQVPLTPAIVEAVIASYPVAKQTADDLSTQYGDVGSGGNDPGAAFAAWLAVGGAVGAMNGAVQPYGFADYQTWVGTLTSVIFAHTFAAEGGNMDAQMAEAIAQIQNNPNLSDAQKEMMLQQMQASMGAVAMMRPSPENVDAVAPYADQIAAMLDSD